MKPSEAMILLSKIASTDKRMAGEAEAHSWAEIMTKADVPLADAIAAAQDHFGESHDYLMPIHIIDRVRTVRRERLTRAGTPPIPGGLEYADEQAWRQLWCSAVKDGDPDPEGVANHAMRITPAIELIGMPAEVRDAITRFANEHSVPAVTK